MTNRIERVDGRSQPIEGATVGGQCTSLGDGDTTLGARKAGYSPAEREIALGFEFEIDFELTRRGASRSRR